MYWPRKKNKKESKASENEEKIKKKGKETRLSIRKSEKIGEKKGKSTRAVPEPATPTEIPQARLTRPRTVVRLSGRP